MDLKKLISQGESEAVEFKESLQLKDEIGESVSSFSNSKGGIILIGIYDTGKIKGIQIGKKTVIDLAEYIKRNTDPPIFPEVSIIRIDDKDVISTKVKPVDEKPVFFKNYAYKRVGSTNQRISSSEIRKLAKETTEKVYWDEQICEEAKLEDIDEERVKWFLKEAGKQGRVNIPTDTPAREVLMRLKLLKNIKPTNSAILLFGKNVEQFFMQSEVKCILLPTLKFAKPYESYQTYSGNLFEQTEKAMIFILENIRQSLWLEPGKIAASSSYEIPEEAIREAIVNAIVHRDYLSPSKIQVRIFPDRIEIWDPGRLPPQLETEDLKRPHPSIPYNPLIFRQFYRVGFVEDVGGGTTDIVEWCKKAGLLEPEFEQKMDFFIIKIKRSTINDEVLGKFDLNERQVKFVKHIEKYGRMIRTEYEKLSLISARTASRELEELCKKGIIERKGKGPATYYLLARLGETWRDKK